MIDPVAALKNLSEWRTEMWPGVTFNESQSFHAGIFRGKDCLCHISLAGPGVDEASGQRALARRAVLWIEAYEAR